MFRFSTSARPGSGGETSPQELGEATRSAAWLGLAITGLVKVFVLLKIQRAAQMSPRQGGMETYTLSTLRCLTPIDFTETKTHNALRIWAQCGLENPARYHSSSLGD